MPSEAPEGARRSSHHRFYRKTPVTDRVHAMRVFIRVVDTNSFTRAAESLGMPRATVSTTIQQLEALLGVQLLARTTRRLNLTADGAICYERCMRILADIEELETGFRESEDQLRGRLRIEMPDTVATALVVPALPDFHERYPHIELSIGISNRTIDLVGESVDCSVQLGERPGAGAASSSTWPARAPTTWICTARPPRWTTWPITSR